MDSAEYDEEIFDDGDFYHELLKEVVTGQDSSSLSFPTRQAKKAKKTKRVRGTKGRVVRMQTMEKLTNFMAPKNTLNEDECPRELLFQSLFGQLVPDSTVVDETLFDATSEQNHGNEI